MTTPLLVLIACTGDPDAPGEHSELSESQVQESQPPNSPVEPTKWASLRAGGWGTCGVTEGGQAACWGGDGQYVVPSPPPGADAVLVVPGVNVAACWIDGQGAGSCAIPWDGSDFDFPAGTWKELELSAAFISACAESAETGTLTCWGANAGGLTSPPDEALSDFSLGEALHCGLAESDSTLRCWGQGIGTGLDTESHPPPEGSFTDLDLSLDYGCAVGTDGELTCWGSGPIEAPVGPFVTVEAAASDACGLGPDGQLECWGDGVWGVQDHPSGRGFTNLTCGVFHCCALNQAHEAVCWGLDAYGATTPPHL